MNHFVPFRMNALLNDLELLSQLKIVIVGVGGIGCQLLKVLCKMVVGSIHIIDMDIIEISNLNRQFLFKTEHKGQSKALVAKETIKQLNPHLNIEAHHKNIREFPISFFQQFNFLIMALDNIQTRNYVNKIGIRLNIPLIDAGTLGYKGNVHIIIPHKTQCYSCQPKITSQKLFPVCTIRMRPDKPIHCVVWAKMLFEVLFSGGDINNDMKDLAGLAEEGNQNHVLKELLHTEIVNIKNAKSDADGKLAQYYVNKITPLSEDLLLQQPTITIQSFDVFQSNKVDSSILVSLAKLSFVKLLEQKKREGSILFEKDNELIIIFISSFANLRMKCFAIEEQSFNEIKNMAGNIVPAIASTNSIVSGLQVIEMIKYISDETDKLRSSYVQNQSYKVRAIRTELPVPMCTVCSLSAKPVIFSLDMKNSNFQIMVDKLRELLQKYEESNSFSINFGEKQFYNSQEPNEKILEKKLIQLSQGTFEMDLIIINEESTQKICTIWIVHSQNKYHLQIHNQQQIHQNIKNQLNHQSQQPQQKPSTDKQHENSDCQFIDAKNNDDQSSDQIVEIRINGKNIQDQIEDQVQKRFH